MNRLLPGLICLILSSFASHAQLLTWTPDFGKDNDNIVITLDATKGNQALNNYSNSNDVYVHIGVITSSSTSTGDWKYATTWLDNAAKYKCTYIGGNKYSFTVSNPRSFFGVSAGETIKRIAILFRNGAGSVVHRNASSSIDNGDMFVPVYDNGLAVRFTNPPLQPYFNPIPETLTKSVGDNIAVTAIASQSSSLKLYLNGTVFQTATSATSISGNPMLTASGNTEIVVEADNGSTVKKDTLKFFVSPGTVVAPLPTGAKDGINYLPGNTSVVLVLYAPAKNRVSVIGEFPGSNWTEQSAYQMKKTPDGNYWWLQIDGLTPGTEYAYQYFVDGSLKIADAYSEKILDPYNNNDANISASTYPGLKTYPAGQSGIVSLLQTNAPAYTWANNSFSRPDKRNLFIYELLVRDFVAAHDWKTIKDTLSYLKRLGVNAVEIMPFNEFEGNESWGYNPDFYFAPDKYYGPKNTLKEFIDACHGMGIAVIMDIALNHSFGLSPFVQLYWDGANNRPAANNPWFNPVPKHAYNVGYDMNHESAATHYYFSRIVAHWLQEYKLDGFRFDLSKGFTQTQTCDANGNNCNVGTWSNTDASRIAIWKGYYDTLQLKSPGSYVILEHFASDDEEKTLSDYGMMLWGNMNYNFNEASMGWIPTSNFERGIYSVRGWNNPYLITYMESHDEERMAYKNINYGSAGGGYSTKDTATSLRRNELCAAFLMSIPGPKMIWQFGELGYDYPINYCISNGTVNDNCRTGNKPIRWDYKQEERRRRLYDIYSSLAKLRADAWYKDVFTANNTTIDRSLGTAFKWLKLRSANDSSMLVIVGNFDINAQTGTFTFPTAGTWYDYLNGGTFTATGTAQSITLQPGEYHLFLNRNLTNVVTTPVSDISAASNKLQAFIYPNPVISPSILDMNMPATAKTQVVLLNSAGQQVSNIFSGILPKGKQRITITDKINNLPAGIYLLRINSGDQAQVVKIMIR